VSDRAAATAPVRWRAEVDRVLISRVQMARRVRQRSGRIQADYIGFSIPNLFVVGYGLDFAERYRNLPFLGVLNPALCRGDATRKGKGRD